MNTVVRGRPLVIGGGGSKNKNRAGETKRKKICAPKMFEKKNLWKGLYSNKLSTQAKNFEKKICTS
jgi:hypothetical protein